MQMTQRNILWISAFAFSVVLSMGYLMFLAPQVEIWQRVSEELTSLQNNIQGLETKMLSLKQEMLGYKNKSEENKEQLSFTFEEKDLETRMKGFMRVLNDLATQTGNRLISIQPYGSGDDERSRKRNNSEDEGNTEDVPEELQRFRAVKEKDMPLYSTELEIRIRGSFAQIKSFIETLTAYKQELVKVETFYLSYEALDSRTMSEFQIQNNGRSASPNRNTDRPLLLVTRLKFYLLEPSQNAFSQAMQEMKETERLEEEKRQAEEKIKREEEKRAKKK